MYVRGIINTKVVSKLHKIRKNYGILLLLLIISILVILPHSTPKLSVRTHLLITGHPVVAVTSEIHATELYDEQAGREYSVSVNKEIVGTENDYSSLKVKRILFLYFARFGAA